MKHIILAFAIALFYTQAYAQHVNFANTPANSAAAIRQNIGHLNDVAGDIFLAFPDSAHKLAGNALLLAEKLNDSLGEGRSFLNLGKIYWSQSYYPVSLFYLKSALQYLPQNRPNYTSDAWRALGRTYADLKDFKHALNDLDSALLLAGNNTGLIAEAFNERSYIYYKQKNYDKALTAAFYALALNKKNANAINIAVLYSRLGVIYLGKNDNVRALAYTDTALVLGNKVNNRRLRAYAFLQYALISNKSGKYDDAVVYAKKAIALADSIGIMDAENQSYYALINSYELKRQLDVAISYQHRFNAVRDSMSTLNKLKTVKLVENYYDLNSKMTGVMQMQTEERVSKTKIRSQHALIEILIASVIVLTIILFATYYFYKQKEDLSNQLQYQHGELLDQKILIEAQAADLGQVNNLKDKLLTVIGHDLRSPIANLTNIVGLFESGFLTAAEVNELMKDLNPVVKGAALTLSNLMDWAGYQVKGRNIQVSQVDVFLLGVEMEQTFSYALRNKHIQFINQAYPGQRVFADENHLKVILRNLISNAIKFTATQGCITLSTTIKDNELTIGIADTGKGMSQDEVDKLFYVDSHFSSSGTSGEKGTGIGLLLCKELVELNGGKLLVSSAPGKGSTFYFNVAVVNAFA